MHEAVRAASVASRLLAFFREPVRYRPQFIHGEAIPDGHFVIKFAQGKFTHGLLRDMPNPERAELREAANAFIRQVCFREEATHYQTLCVPPDAKREAIKEHYHLLMALIHPDRQDAALEQWPTGCSQRVNRAYAVLSEEALRRGYDEGLRKTAAGATHQPEAQAQESHVAQGRARRRRGWVRTRFGMSFVVITPVVAALFIVQTLWVNDVPGEYSVLERATPLSVSARWMRDALSSGERPRYMETEAAAQERETAAAERAKESEPTSLFGSFWKPWGGDAAMPSPAPVRTQAVPSTRKEPEARAAVAASAEPVARRDAGRVPAEGALVAERTTATVARSVIVQASAPASAPESRVTPEAIETIVARLVSYYEAGETDKLMSLIDPNETGFWKTAQIRQEYLEFFRATSKRRLRVNNLAWHTVNDSAQARGVATVSAEYFDERGSLERKVDVELDIALRDGKAKLTRLTLFPNGK